MGGTTKLSTYVAAAICALFVVAHPLCAVVGYMPTLVVAAICVYIGADFLYDNLAEPFAAALGEGGSGGLGRALSAVAGSWAVLLLCVKKDMLLGTVVGVLGFQVAARLKK